MQPTLRQPTTADQLLRLVQLQEHVLAACEVRPEDVAPELEPFDAVAELLLTAVDERDLPQVRRLTAALDFAGVVRLARQAYDQGDVAALPGFVQAAEAHVAELDALPLGRPERSGV